MRPTSGQRQPAMTTSAPARPRSRLRRAEGRRRSRRAESRAGCAVARSIADYSRRLARLDPAGLLDCDLEPDDGLHRIGRAGRRIAAVERIARTHEIIVGRCGEEDAGRIGEGRRQFRQRRARIFETRDLVALSGLSGSSDETKWLISKSAPSARRGDRERARSSASEAKPSRFMPVSRWSAQGRAPAAPKAAHRASSSARRSRARGLARHSRPPDRPRLAGR